MAEAGNRPDLKRGPPVDERDQETQREGANRFSQICAAIVHAQGKRALLPIGGRQNRQRLRVKTSSSSAPSAMKISKTGKLEAALSPRQLRPIIPRQSPKKFRRLARSAKNPEGKLATPAINVRAEARAPACARLKPNAVVISGKITAMTPLKRCSNHMGRGVRREPAPGCNRRR